MDILSDILQNSSFKQDAINRERGVILREMQEVENQTEEVVFDKLHEAAFRWTSLGYPILGPKENIERFNREDLVDFITTHYTAPRIVIAAAGDVEHKDIVKLSQSLFSSLPTSPPNGKKVVMTPAPFIGSDIYMRYDSHDKAHVAIGYRIGGWNDPDNYPLMVMQSMIGSWQKDVSGVHGLYSSSNMVATLAKWDIAKSASTFITQYSDTGLFGIYLVCGPTGQQEAIHYSLKDLCAMSYDVDLARVIEAKNQLKANILHSLDGTQQICEDIGRSIIAWNRRMHPTEVMARIDAVDPCAIQSAARRFFHDTDHAAAAIGPLYETPDYNWIRRRSFWLRY
jgi:processing peptidase subunit beta